MVYLDVKLNREMSKQTGLAPGCLPESLLVELPAEGEVDVLERVRSDERGHLVLSCGYGVFQAYRSFLFGSKWTQDRQQLIWSFLLPSYYCKAASACLFACSFSQSSTFLHNGHTVKVLLALKSFETTSGRRYTTLSPCRRGDPHVSYEIAGIPHAMEYAYASCSFFDGAGEC